MSDRLEEIKKERERILDGRSSDLDVPDALGWMASQIDRLRASNEQLLECNKRYVGCSEDYEETIKSLRSNQIPGRCGECERFKPAVYEPSPGETTVPRYWCYLTGLRDPKGFCHEWKPKE